MKTFVFLICLYYFKVNFPIYNAGYMAYRAYQLGSSCHRTYQKCRNVLEYFTKKDDEWEIIHFQPDFTVLN